VYARVRDEALSCAGHRRLANSRTAIQQVYCNSGTEIGPAAPGHIETGRWYKITMEVKGSHVRCLLDGKVVNEGDLRRQASRRHAWQGRDEKAGEVIIKLVNAMIRP